MREIRFRGKRVDNGKWVYGSYVRLSFDYIYPEVLRTGVEDIFGSEYKDCIIYKLRVIPETVGQYTGLKDKNGVEIYEGDIIKVVTRWDSANMIVLFEHAQFVLKTEDSLGFKVLGHMNNLEVIGNIHESEGINEK